VTAERLLQALADGRAHSGEELARAAGVAVAALSRHVGTLAGWGLVVEAAPHAGYRLSRSLDLLDAERLRATLEPAVVARLARLEVFTEIDSTNARLLATPPSHGELDVCIAEFQSAGRGRRGRRWNSPLGSGICLSVGYRFSAMPPEPAALTLAVGVAVRRVLARVAGLTIALKWPNDLVFDERKLGGILLELKAPAHGGAHVVAGVGLNVAVPSQSLSSLSDWPRGGIDLATALGEEPPPRAVLAGALVNELAAVLADYPARGFAAYRAEWRSADYLRGRAVRLDEPAGACFGTSLGIDADGALLVETEAGDHRHVAAGEVTVRSGR
jgi:BirA family biotin operon repressor/biotin-[acetyl-CoA-carboxylase] ligase